MIKGLNDEDRREIRITFGSRSSFSTKSLDFRTKVDRDGLNSRLCN